MKDRIFLILGIIGLLFGVASPLPIWPGPLIYRHLTPGIVSAILIIISCLGSLKKGSKIVGIIGILYGILAIIAGVFFSVLLTLLNSAEANTIFPLAMLGTAVALTAGIISLILGYKTYKAKKDQNQK